MKPDGIVSVVSLGGICMFDGVGICIVTCSLTKVFSFIWFSLCTKEWGMETHSKCDWARGSVAR